MLDLTSYEKEEFIKSDFYRKYKDTYWSDSILQEVFGVELEKHKIKGYDSMAYEEIYKLNLDVFTDYFADPYIRKLFEINAELIWKIQKAFYLDPDCGSVKVINGISCTADGLISRKRISKHIKSIDEFIPEYEMTRKYPFVYFPDEWDGINGLRAITFGDRIDHTLLDLKNYLDPVKREKCKLKAAYELPVTKAWLTKLGSFKNLIDSLELRGLLVNEQYEILDIEKGDGSVLKEYALSYSWDWSEEYYDNLKKIILYYNSIK